MGQRLKKFLESLDPVVHLFFLLAIVALAAGFFYLWSRPQPVRVQIQEKVQGDSGVTLAEAESLIAKAIATISAVPKTVVQKVTTIKKPQTSYIPLGATATTTNTDWVAVTGSEVFVDLVNDFGEDAQVSWEASLKVAHGNGTAYARLWDDTHKIAVNGSEISTQANQDFQTVWKDSLSLWRGRNVYSVQIKSLNGYEVTYTNGRMKISY